MPFVAIPNKHNLKISSEFSFLAIFIRFYAVGMVMDVICDILLPDIIERKRRRGGGNAICGLFYVLTRVGGGSFCKCKCRGMRYRRGGEGEI